ncbi:MAG: hypothetical protein JWM93_2019 [Frankiales bacterium]|nr:hypothetical protein [Frankiales bacterium]
MSKKLFVVVLAAMAGVLVTRKVASDRAEHDLWHDATDDLETS